MSRLADPTTCPECRVTLDSRTCPECGVVLEGPRAAELWLTMLRADRLVGELRRTPVTVAAPASPPQVPAAGPAAGPAPAPVSAPVPAPAGQVRGRSVAVVLLALGGLCLVVFAAIFLGVAWELLGLTGRSVVMAGLTAGLGAVAVVLTRRGLRASAETLWLVTGGLCLLDLYAASSAGLLGGLGVRGTSSLVALVLLLLGAGAAQWSRGTRSGTLVGPQLLGTLGLAVAAVAWLAVPGDPSAAAAVLVLVVLVVAVGATAGRLGVLALSTTVLAGMLWLTLVALGWGRATDPDATGAWWRPLLLAAVVAAGVAALPSDLLPGWARSVAAGASLLPAVLLLNASALTGDDATVALLLAAATEVLLLGVVLRAPRTWARPAAAYAVLGAGALLAALALVPVEPPVTGGAPYPATWLVLAVVVALAVLVLLRARPVPHTARVGEVAALVVLPLGAWDVLLAAGVGTSVAVVGGVVATAAAAGAAWWAREQLPAALVGVTGAAWAGALTLWQTGAEVTDPRTAAVLSTLAVPLLLAGVARDRASRPWSAAALLAVGALLGGLAVHAWCEVADAPAPAHALALAAYAAVLLLAWPLTRLPLSAAALQVSAVPVVLGALDVDPDPRTGTLVLGVAAAALALGLVLDLLAGRSRPAVVAPLSAVAATVAVLAALWRADAGLTVPELVALPAAVVLLGAGLLRLGRNTADGPGSLPCLAPGLAALLIPSLLLALEEPVSLRGALVALAGVVLLVVGIVARLGAPFLAGAAVTALLALRHLEPVADAVPRWIVIGVVGAALLSAGVTWEAGLRRLGVARRYVASLR